MADRTDPTHSAARPPSQRFRKIAQAALNADMTLDQVEELLGGMAEILEGMNDSMGNLDGAVVQLQATMSHMNQTLDRVDDMAARMSTIVSRMEGIVGRIENLVSLGEVAMLPVSALESAGRGIASILGLGDSKANGQADQR